MRKRYVTSNPNAEGRALLYDTHDFGVERPMTFNIIHEWAPTIFGTLQGIDVLQSFNTFVFDLDASTLLHSDFFSSFVF